MTQMLKRWGWKNTWNFQKFGILKEKLICLVCFQGKEMTYIETPFLKRSNKAAKISAESDNIFNWYYAALVSDAACQQKWRAKVSVIYYIV